MLRRLLRRRLPGSEIPLPPRKLIDEVGGEYRATGVEFLGYFTELARLRPDESVLEVGCGCGRMAVPLTRYFDDAARYEGFDIQRAAIRWCTREITSRFPSFRFRWADVYSKRYNPRGRRRAREYRFPYDDGDFDFVFLTSVFTHMLRDDVEHYLDEIARVTKPDGRCLITYFLLNGEAHELMAADKSTLTFPHEVERTAVWKKDVPEAVVAFPDDDVRRSLEARGLEIDEPIHYGDWCGRHPALSCQDIVIVRPAPR